MVCIYPAVIKNFFSSTCGLDFSTIKSQNFKIVIKKNSFTPHSFFIIIVVEVFSCSGDKSKIGILLEPQKDGGRVKAPEKAHQFPQLRKRKQRNRTVQKRKRESLIRHLRTLRSCRTTGFLSVSISHFCSSWWARCCFVPPRLAEAEPQ